MAAATTNGIEPPPKFLPATGPPPIPWNKRESTPVPPIPWNEWRPLFETYCDAIDFDDFADKKQKAILLNCLGTEGQKRFSKLPDATYPQGATEYTKALLKLEKEYKQVKNKQAERYVFRKHAQLQGESISEYVAALHDLATTCNFSDFLDDTLSDQLIKKLHNSKIRERLLAEEKLDLTKAVKTAGRLESAIKDAKSMRESMSANGTEHGSVIAVKKKNSQPYYKKPTGDHAKSISNAKIQNACYRWGSPKHKANFKTCPALGQTCRKCGNRDHYEKVCLADCQTKVHQLEEAESESDDYVLTVDPSDKHDRPCPCCIVKIQGTPINVLVDSGSPYTIIPKALYDSLFSKCKLHESDISPGGYGGSPIAIQGFFKAALQYEDRSDTDKVYVSKKGATILGWSAQSKLRIVLYPTCNDPVLQTSNIVDQYPEVFEHNNTKVATHVSHKILWKPDAKPVQHNVRNIPWPYDLP